MKIDITKFNPCKDSLLYYDSQPDSETAWNNCPRGDWMLWIAQKLDVDVRTLTLAKGLCANTVRHLMKDERSIKAVDAAIAFGKGQITREELDKTFHYAINAAHSAHTTYAAAYAAANAANAADTTGAAYVSVAIYSTNTSVYDAAKKIHQKQTADICREILTEEVFNKIKLL